MVWERVWCGCVARRGVVGCVAREGERWDVRAGAWRGVWLGACVDGEKFEGVGMTAQKVSLAVLDALRVTALRK